MDKEMQAMNDRKVWNLVEPPKEAKVLGCRWVYSLKRNEQNEIVRYKARLVTQGFKQVKGENYDEVFSPVVNFSIMRLFFAIFFKWFHTQLDVNDALYARLNEVICMQQPEGYVNEANKCRLILLLYVDDIVMFGETKKDSDNGITLLQGHFDLKIQGKIKKLLGIEEKNKKKLYIHQSSYIEKLCKQYEMFKCPVSSLPIPKGLGLSKLDCPSSPAEINEMAKYPYRNLIAFGFVEVRLVDGVMFTAGWCVNHVWVQWMSMSSPRYRLRGGENVICQSAHLGDSGTGSTSF
ncbi:retrovirus-related Pol polyprotein from transposon TNT 1-94 [Trichonephila clavipes]|nr:retrovirus-related Pol polyprotein from transposon TNT 1-94 [Trichonephila clavipes]